MKDITYNMFTYSLCSEIVKFRMMDKGIMYQDKKDETIDHEAQLNGSAQHANGSSSNYKFVCSKLEERGAVGETPLHVCLLCGTSLHADLAKRLLKNFPKLINDIYMSDEYYGTC